MPQVATQGLSHVRKFLLVGHDFLRHGREQTGLQSQQLLRVFDGEGIQAELMRIGQDRLGQAQVQLHELLHAGERLAGHAHQGLDIGLVRGHHLFGCEVHGIEERFRCLKFSPRPLEKPV